MTNAQLYGEKFKKFADKLNSNLYYSDYHFAKFEIDSVGGNYLSAIKHYQTYKKFKEKLLDEKKRKEITKLNVLYETEKKDKNIESLKRQTVLQKENIKQAHKIQYFTFGMLLLALIIIYSMYRVYKHKQKTNIILEKQQDEINQQNISLQHLLTEKEWLLKEVHHRVKNNLHIVVGLLASQTEFLKGKEALLAIADSQRRIETMSLIHQKLYQSENLSMLGMPSYIFELTEYLKDSFDMDKSIRFKREIENIEFPLSHTIPIGLILNEAVTNAIKYAFLTVKEGIITITLKKLTSEHYILCIHDNGIGLPLDFDPYNSPTFGMKLMLGLSDDIKGNFKIVNDKGTKITLEFAITSETT